MSNLKLVIAYDGAGFHGWQNSIEKALQDVLEQILQQKIVLQAASRTDAGVHADAQVVNFFLKGIMPDLSRLHLSLNRLLPASIAVLSIEKMPLTFHPTLDALSKEYHYHVSYDTFQLPHDRHRFFHFPCQALDIEAMQLAAKQLVGVHDFSAFTWVRKQRDYQTLVRELTSVEIHPLDLKRLQIKLCGVNFLYRMARTIAGTLLAVGRGKVKIEEVLQAKDRRIAGITAPAHGLTLHRVYY